MIRLTTAVLAAGLFALTGGARPVRAAAATSPDALRGIFAVEDAAEGIAEGAAQSTGARTAAASAATHWRAVRVRLAATADARLIGEADRAVAAMRTARDGEALRRAANDVTGALAPLFAFAGEKVPAAVHRLDYLGRSVALDARSADWTRATADAAALEQTWSSLRPQTVARANGGRAARSCDRAARAVAAAVRSHDAQRAVAAAARSGNAVDELEKVFAG